MAKKRTGETMFGKKKQKQPSGSYDKERQQPILRCSICTGEQVAGFRNLDNGKFEEVSVIRGEGDLEKFLSAYGIKREEIRKEY